ncbi:tRNA-dependent cyclodipeptide synthase [Streptomyces sp. NRRL B-24484]|uniref:tRNA-dependent cyclodipeptide synthase n=1 Tax=Streptomyces sp. NRRL B-24484 TaxID=1463833 RepID=UPI0004C1849C|nr:tRNA-dependent cyclodipeptide synthase [Streptomyces sp. NRRL B-24484]
MSETLLSTTIDEFQAFPYSARCHRVFARGDHLLIGVSPGNSYFSARRITQLVHWGKEFFATVDIVHADLHVDAQFGAQGYPPEAAARRAAKEVKATRRRVERGAADAGRPGVRTHALSDFTGGETYRRLHAEVLAALADDRPFREAAERMALGFLRARLDGAAPTADQLAAGLRYIAAELPFFLDTPALLGVPSSVACYHVELPLTPVLFGRPDGLRAAPGQAYAVVRPADAAADRRAA